MVNRRNMLVGFGIAGGLMVISLSLWGHHAYRNRRLTVSGEVFFLSDKGLQMAPGVTVHFFKKPTTQFEGQFAWQKQKRRDDEDCGSVTALMVNELAENPEGVESKFLYRPYNSTVRGEWKEISSSQEFKDANHEKQLNIRREFWLLRAFVDDTLERDVLAEEPELKQFTSKSLDLDNPEFMAWYSQQQRLRLGFASTTTDAKGNFSIRLPQGDYVVVAEGKVLVDYIDLFELKVLRKATGSPKHYGPQEAVWFSPLAVSEDTKLPLGEPVCVTKYAHGELLKRDSK